MITRSDRDSLGNNYTEFSPPSKFYFIRYSRFEAFSFSSSLRLAPLHDLSASLPAKIAVKDFSLITHRAKPLSSRQNFSGAVPSMPFRIIGDDKGRAIRAEI